MNRKRFLALCLVCLLVFSLTGCQQAQDLMAFFRGQTPTELAKELEINGENYPVIDGSTSTLPIVQGIYKAMFGDKSDSGARYPTEASKTVPSYEKLINGEVDMIFVPYASQAVLDLAAEKGVTLEFYRIAAEALIFITPAENPIEEITAKQIREIYVDRSITNWSQLGGPDRELVPICRNADSGSQSQMDNLILMGEPMHPAIKNNYVELTMEGMLEQVAFYHSGGMSGTPTNSYALGYTLFTYLEFMNELTGIGEHLKILSFEGTAPSKNSLADGSYSLTDGYYAVVRSDLPRTNKAWSILSWLQGDGAAMLKELGLLPVE